MIQDSFSRTIDYVRVAVTDRCNLRCFYCMPKEGIPYEPKAHLLSYEEIVRVLSVLGELGFKKVRFTGGEPFLRKDFIKLLEQTHLLGNYQSINLTTNGTLIEKHIPLLESLGIKDINLSLDTLDSNRFYEITRRKDFDKVISTLHRLLDRNFRVKINAVIMYGINTQDILPLAALAKNHPLSVRFIEEMPFNGGTHQIKELINAREIFEILLGEYPEIQKQKMLPGATATQLNVPGFQGDLGIIAAFSRTFCNTCNRLRITAKGDIKTCLYDGGVFSLRDFLRSGVSDERIKDKMIELIKLKPKDGFEAEEKRNKNTPSRESMSTIGG